MLDHERPRVYQLAIKLVALALRIIQRLPRCPAKLGD